MDQESLVKSGHVLLSALDKEGLTIHGAMWVELRETSSWRLWIICDEKADKRDFYRIATRLISEMEKDFPELSISDVELKSVAEPVIQALGMMLHLEGGGACHLSRNMMNGIYTPDGIALRMKIPRK